MSKKLNRIKSALIIVVFVALFFSCDSKYNDLLNPSKSGSNHNSHSGGGDSGTSSSSSSTSTGGNNYKVDGSLKATVLTQANKITITWNAVSGVTGYALYKYISKTDANPVRITVASNSYEDTTCTAGAPYFYKVACIKDTDEYPKTDYFAFGICYTSIDYYESYNDDISNIINNPTDLFDPGNPPVIYSVSDGAGNTIRDTDWYKYNGPQTTVFARITLPADTAFDDGELTFKWYYNGSYSGAAQPIVKGITNEFSFSDFGGAAGDIDLYCEITISTPAGVNKIGSYQMDISTSF